MVRQDFLESIVNVIQEEERTVFLSSHLVHELERVADRVGIIEGGKLIVSDDIDTVKNSVKEVILQNQGSETLDLPSGDFQLSDEGTGAKLTVYDFDDQKLETIKQTGAHIVDVRDLPLEQAFVAHLRRQAGGTE
jgi:ABC-2 type transport system ATP-binding protein